MGDRTDETAVSDTVRIINDYIIDGPTVADRQNAG